MFFMAFVASSDTTSADEGASLYGIGVIRCYEYIETAHNDMMEKLRYFHWAQGFLSAINLSQELGWTLKPDAFGVQAQMKAVDAYCIENGEDPYFAAVLNVLVKLGDHQ